MLAIATYFIFAEQLPFTNHYTVKAVLQNSNLLVQARRSGSAAWTSALRPGRYRNAELAQVTMQIDLGPKPHADATLRVRPRLFLEGNLLDLTTGTPNAPQLSNGGTIPLGHTFDPVQIDQLFDGFPQDNRRRSSRR